MIENQCGRGRPHYSRPGGRRYKKRWRYKNGDAKRIAGRGRMHDSRPGGRRYKKRWRYKRPALHELLGAALGDEAVESILALEGAAVL
jgi:hypothetical protein